MNKVLFALLLVSFSCSNFREYKIRFNHVLDLNKRAPVFINGVNVGQVKQVEFNNDTALATIQVEKYIKVSTDSKFILNSVFSIGESIEIVLGSNTELLDEDQIATGILVPEDSSLVQKFSFHELDSLAKVDDKYRLVDTIVKVLKKIKEDKN